MRKIYGKSGKILNVLKDTLNISTNKIKKLLDNYFVFVNDKVVYISSYEVKKKDKIEVLLYFPQFKKGKIIFENEDFIILDKPPFLDVYEIQKLFLKDLFIVHRLDKFTSGLLIFAKSEKVKEEFIKIFKQKKIYKEYRAIVYGKVKKYKKLIYSLDRKEAITIINPISYTENYSYLKVEILTGRKHQIRRHLSKISHPIVKDILYGPKIIKDEKIKLLPRFMLHAFRLKFFFKGKLFDFISPVPEDFKKALSSLSL